MVKRKMDVFSVPFKYSKQEWARLFMFPNSPAPKNRRSYVGVHGGKRNFDRFHYPRYRQAMQRGIAEKSRTLRRKSNLEECPFIRSA